MSGRTIRLPHGWDERERYEVSIPARWHFLGIVSFCSRATRRHGRLPLVSALRSSDVPDPNSALAELASSGAVRLLDGGMVQVVGIEEFLPPISAMAKREQRAVTHILYRLFANDGTLLYVGRTNNLDSRLRRHSRTQPWWDEVASHRTENFPAFDQLTIAERAAIVHEHPRYNKVHNTPPPLHRDAQDGTETGRAVTGSTTPAERSEEEERLAEIAEHQALFPEDYGDDAA